MTEISGVHYFEQPNMKKPIMLAAWPGMGAVASQAVNYVRRKLKATLFAEIDTRDFNVPYSVVISEGIGNFPESPRVLLYFSEEYDLFFCEGEEQFAGRSALKVADRLLKIAEKYHISKIFTGAAFVQHMNHRDQPFVYSVANTPRLRDWLVHENGVSQLKRGQISGLNGSILGFATQKNIDAACFLSTIPIYAVNLPNPKAAMAIVKVWQRILGFDCNFDEFESRIKETDHALAMVEEQLKKLAIGSITEDQDEDEDKDFSPPNKTPEIPPDVRRRIERLFKSAKKDKTIAHRLKEELDRWDLFKQYEDRFLDLFRDSQ